MAQSIGSKGRPSLIAPRQPSAVEFTGREDRSSFAANNRRRPLLDEMLHVQVKIQALFYALVDFDRSRD
jgi:hypothetical protein